MPLAVIGTAGAVCFGLCNIRLTPNKLKIKRLVILF
jgi:hypothetical protein